MTSHSDADTDTGRIHPAENAQSAHAPETEFSPAEQSRESIFDPTAAKHVILLSIDALRADYLGCYGSPRDLSPTIDRLATAGIRFDRAYSPSSHTREAVPALLSGQYPSVATTDNYRLDSPTIATSLQGTPARSAGIHSNPFVSEGFGYGDGFDHFDDDMLAGGHPLTALAQRAIDKLRDRHYARAETVTDRGVEFLRSQAVTGGRPTFTWLHYMDVHGPYKPPAEFQSRYVGDQNGNPDPTQLYERAIREPGSISQRDRQLLVDLYAAEIASLDTSIARLLEELTQLGIRDETLLLLTADHGEAFGEPGYYEHPRFLPDVLTHVPLIATGAGVSSRPTVESPVSTLDIAPTIAEAFGVDYRGPGTSLAATAHQPDPDRVVFAQARGEGEDDAIRRYASYRAGGTAHAQVNTATGDPEVDAEEDPAGTSLLTDHIEADGYPAKGGEPAPAGGEQTTADGVEEHVSHRLQALGYTE